MVPALGTPNSGPPAKLSPQGEETMGPKGRVIWRLCPLWATLWVPRALRFPAQMALSPIPRPGWVSSADQPLRSDGTADMPCPVAEGWPGAALLEVGWGGPSLCVQAEMFTHVCTGPLHHHAPGQALRSLRILHSELAFQVVMKVCLSR